MSSGKWTSLFLPLSFKLFCSCILYKPREKLLLSILGLLCWKYSNEINFCNIWKWDTAHWWWISNILIQLAVTNKKLSRILILTVVCVGKAALLACNISSLTLISDNPVNLNSSILVLESKCCQIEIVRNSLHIVQFFHVAYIV